MLRAIMYVSQPPVTELITWNRRSIITAWNCRTERRRLGSPERYRLGSLEHHHPGSPEQYRLDEWHGSRAGEVIY